MRQRWSWKGRRLAIEGHPQSSCSAARGTLASPTPGVIEYGVLEVAACYDTDISPGSACCRMLSPAMPCAGVPMTGGIAAAMAAATPAALERARGVGQAVSQARQAPAQALLQVHPNGPAPRFSAQRRLRAGKLPS